MTTGLIIIFIIGYVLITLEHKLNLNKAAPALLSGVLCWLLYILSQGNHELVNEQLFESIAEISGLLFFLIGAMTIVELMDAHDAFDIIINKLKSNDKRKIIITITIVSFVLSSVLDNLTTAIVMTTICRKIINNKQDRWMILGLVIIAANAGGAWSPIGDVTTTMLWLAGKVGPLKIMAHLILPSLICILVPLVLVIMKTKGEMDERETSAIKDTRLSSILFYAGIASLCFIPVFKTLTGLPPFMGMLFSLGVMWIFTEVLHRRKDVEEKNQYSVISAIQRIDVPSIMFFLGILLSVAALNYTGVLASFAQLLNGMGNENFVAVTFGIFSAVVDNVPLVAASINMYDFPIDHQFWNLLCFSAGTGGSILIIGSAAGVAVMGLENIPFGWYLKKISALALIGFASGVGVFYLQQLF